jgi:hypothetical protein
MMITLGIATAVIGTTITSSLALQKSLAAVDSYFATHMQQIRIVDYINRDVKRGLSVTTSVDLQSVTISAPKYLIQAGDPEAVANPALVDTPRTPVVSRTAAGLQVNYATSASSVVYSISGQTVIRTENGVVTTIASSTDELVPKTTDVELANTEHTKTTVTFKPIFRSGDQEAARTGTTLYSTAYLRNRRRA